MASKPTGRPRGRPRKIKSEKLLRARGRPKIALREDPDRYLIAAYQALLNFAQADGYSELKVAETIVSFRYGQPTLTPENVAAANERKPFQVYLPKRNMERYRIVSPGPTWRDRNAFRPLADNLRRKARRVKGDQADLLWLNSMVAIWRITLLGLWDFRYFASYLAQSLDERDYFEGKMMSIFLEKLAGRGIGYDEFRATLV